MFKRRNRAKKGAKDAAKKDDKPDGAVKTAEKESASSSQCKGIQEALAKQIPAQHAQVVKKSGSKSETPKENPDTQSQAGAKSKSVKFKPQPQEKEEPEKKAAEPSSPRSKQIDLKETLRHDKENEKKALQHLFWFFDDFNRNFAEIELRKNVAVLKKSGNCNGLFLVRDSPACPGDYVLSLFDKGDFCHYQIHRRHNWKYVLDKGESFAGLDRLIAHYQKNDSGLPSRLTQPCKSEHLPPLLSIFEGYTNFLHRTIADENEKLATKILQHEDCPEVNSRNEEGYTTLHLACMKGLENVVKLLLKKDACISVIDREDYTPLQRACLANKPLVMRILLEQGGASPQGKCPKTGDVALHLAARNGFPDCVQVLLEHNAPAWPQNGVKMAGIEPDSKTPHNLAVKFGHKKCADLIDDYVPPTPNVSPKDWFHEELDRAGAIELMAKHHNQAGLFLVRKSTTHKGSLVISGQGIEGHYHYEIHKFQLKTASTYYIDYGPFMPSLEHLIQHLILFPEDFPHRLRVAIKPDGNLKTMVNEDDEIEEDDYVHYQVSRRESLQKTMTRKDSVPNLPPPPPPVSRQRSNPLSDSTTNTPAHTPLKHTGSAPMTRPRSTEPLMLEGKKIKLLYELGQGEYGSVMKGTYEEHDGMQVDVAIKTLNKKHTDAGKDVFMNEAKVMVKLNHEYIVRLIGVCEGPPPMLVEELLPCGSMLDFLLDYPERINVRRDLYTWAAQIACGMGYLESKGFVHRDLAARNVLMASKRKVKVGDFGLSRAIQGDNDYYTASHGGRWPIKWYAPESVNFGTFSSASDVWGYGITLWEMFSFGDQPYGHKTGAQVVEYLEKGGRLEKTEHCPENVYEVMLLCWSYKSSERPTFKELYLRFREDPNYMNAQFFYARLASNC